MNEALSTSMLKPWEDNPRAISEQALSGLKYSMEEFGDLSLIVFNTRTDRLVCGHQRMRGQTEKFGQVDLINDMITDGRGDRFYHFDTPDGRFTVRFVDWDEDKELAANVAANAGTIQGTFNDELAGVLKKIKTSKKDAFDKMLFSDLMQEQSQKAKEEKLPGEIQFSQELDFESNYVVLTFSKDVDWLYIQSLFGMDSVYSKRSNGKPWSKGQGRVIGGMDALARIKAAVLAEHDSPDQENSFMPSLRVQER